MACETFSFADELFYTFFFFFLEGLSKINSITCTRVRKMEVQHLEQLSWKVGFAGKYLTL